MLAGVTGVVDTIHIRGNRSLESELLYSLTRPSGLGLRLAGRSTPSINIAGIEWIGHVQSCKFSGQYHSGTDTHISITGP